MIEDTLVIIKPDAVRGRHVGHIISEFEAQYLFIEEMISNWLSRGTAEAFYAEHREQPFFPALVDHMISGPIVVLHLSGDSAISRVRAMLGHRQPSKADWYTLRYRYGSPEDGPANAVHASDSPEAAAREIQLLFG